MTGERIRELRKKNGWTQKDLAKKINVSPQVVSNWERGYTNPDPDDIAKMSDCFGETADYILTGKKNLNELRYLVESIKSKNHNVAESTTQYDSPLIRIPVLGYIKAGYDLYAEQQIIGYEIMSREEVQDGEYFYLVVKGDSMIDEGIREGFRVLVKRQDFVEEGKIGVILVNGDEATLKRVYSQEDRVVLQASNRNIPPRILPIEDVKIQGQVTKVEFDV